MSWQDKIENTPFIITTGDNENYTVLWTESEQSFEFNVSEFNFIELDGTLIKRKKRKSQKIPLNIIFQGENHIDISDQFLESSKDPRYWTLDHPVLGIVYGHPASIQKTNSDLNTVSFSIDFWETIRPGQELAAKVYPLESIENKNNEYAEFISLNEIDVQKSDLKSFVEKTNSRYSVLLDPNNTDKYKAMIAEATQSIDNMLTKPAEVIKAINNLIQFPAYISGVIRTRVNLVKAILDDIKDIFNNDLVTSIFGGSVVSTVALIILQPSENDYITRRDVNQQFTGLQDLYSEYLDSVDNGRFTQDWQEAITLNSIVTDTLFYLYDVSFNAKQERFDIIDRDTNLILLTHKYMGLDKNDRNLDVFREINGIRNRIIFIIRKGRKITYLV